MDVLPDRARRRWLLDGLAAADAESRHDEEQAGQRRAARAARARLHLRLRDALSRDLLRHADDLERHVPDLGPGVADRARDVPAAAVPEEGAGAPARAPAR